MKRGLAVAAALLVLGGAAFLLRDRGSLPTARDVVADDGRWDTGSEAATALAAVADVLVEEAGDCDPAEPRCHDLLQAVGWLQVEALTAFRCTQPYVARLRDATRTLVTTLDANAAHTDLPPLITC